MSLFDFKNNSLFLQNWRERMRLPSVLSAILLVSIIVILIFADAIINEHSYFKYGNDYLHPKETLIPWPHLVLVRLAYFQGIIMLLIATFWAHKMASRERSSGTLEFHRASPTPQRNQVLGLLLGSTTLERSLFLGLFFIQIVLCLFASIPIGILMRFEVSLLLTAFFFHSGAILLGISHSVRPSKMSFFQIFIGGYFLLAMLFANQLSIIYNITWMPAYERLTQDLDMGSFFGHTYYSIESKKLLTMFFGFPINPLLFQFLLQLPFIGMFFSGITRKIRNNESPFFSKGQTLLIIFFLLFLYIGSTFNNFFSLQYYYAFEYKSIISSYFVLAIALGVLGCLIATPDKLSFEKGLRRCKKIGAFRLHSGDDQSSNFIWLVNYAFIILVTLAFYVYFLKIDLLRAVYVFLILISYVIIFGGFWQYFSFTFNSSKRIIFWTLLIIFWIIFPLIQSIFFQGGNTYFLKQFFNSFSPIGGIESINGLMLSKNIMPNITLGITAFLSILAIVLAYVSQTKITKSIE